MLRLALLAALLGIVHATCPQGFDLVYGGKCQKLQAEATQVNTDLGKIPAPQEKECGSLNALPVIIKNLLDHEHWLNIATESHKKGWQYGNILLGLKCNSSSRWQWSDGSALTFTPPNVYPPFDDTCDQKHESQCMWDIEAPRQNWARTCGGSPTVDVYCITEPQPLPEPDSVCTNFDDDICYEVGMTPSNWTEANRICNSFASSVASIHSEQENKFLRRLATSKGNVNMILLGGRWNSKTNTITWADGSADDYKNFAPGYPSSSSGECIAMLTGDVTGQWVNVDCAKDLPFACVKPIAAAFPVCDGSLYKEGDIIYSPGFPSSSSQPCDFLLKVEPGMLVEVQILFLEANECCDHLELFEGPLGGSQIAKLSGEQRAGQTFRTSSENVMRASWKPHGGVNVRGMMITFRGVPKS